MNLKSPTPSAEPEGKDFIIPNVVYIIATILAYELDLTRV